ncbi:helicase HerA domain-containing protein, partial [Staphylococcus simulans]
MTSSKSKADEVLNQFIKKHWRILLIILTIATAIIFKNKTISLINSLLDVIGENITNIILVIILLSIVLFFRDYIKRKRRVFYRVMPYVLDKTNVKDLHRMLKALHNSQLDRLPRFLLGREWKSFYIHRNSKGKYEFYIAFDKSLVKQIETSFKIVHHKCNFEHIEKSEMPLPNKKNKVGARLTARKKRKKKILPFNRVKDDHMASIINAMKPETYISVDLLREKESKLARKISNLEDDLNDVNLRDRTGIQRSELLSLRKRFMGSEVSFSSYINLSAEGEADVQDLRSIANVITSTFNDENELVYRKYKHSISWYVKRLPTIEMWNGGRLYVTGQEIAQLVHLPDYSVGDDFTERLLDLTDLYDETTDLLEGDVFNHEDGVTVGYATLANGTERSIKILVDALKAHSVVTGKTGTGKSSFIVAMLNGLLKEHSDKNKADKATGITFIDPGRDTALTLYNRLLQMENEGAEFDWDKINFISVGNTQYPLALNLLDKDTSDTQGEINYSAIAEAVSDIIETAIPNEAPIAKRLMSKCIETLLRDNEPHTIFDVKLLIEDVAYRNKVTKRVFEDPMSYELRSYWENDANKHIETSATALKSRLDIFSSSNTLKRMFGQTRNEMNFKDMLDDGHIYLLDVAGLSQSELRIISGYLSYRLYRASLGRDSNSRQHIIAFDETKVLGSMPYVTKIVAETRKYNLATMIGAQMFGQLDKHLKEALQEIQDTFISLQQGSKEAKEVANYVSDERVNVLPKQLEKLKTREGYLAIKDFLNNGSSERFTVKAKINPLTKYSADGEAVKYKSSGETKAIEWTIKHAESSRKFKKSIGHKHEVDFEIMKRGINFTDLDKSMLFEYTPMTEEKYNHLEAIRNGEIKRENFLTKLNEGYKTARYTGLESVETTSEKECLENEDDNMEIQEVYNDQIEPVEYTLTPLEKQIESNIVSDVDNEEFEDNGEDNGVIELTPIGTEKSVSKNKAEEAQHEEPEAEEAQHEEPEAEEAQHEEPEAEEAQHEEPEAEEAQHEEPEAEEAQHEEPEAEEAQHEEPEAEEAQH